MHRIRQTRIVANNVFRILLICVTGLLSLRCENQTSSVENHDVYLIPMAVGNQWHYQRDLLDSLGNVLATTNETVRIYGDTLVGNLRWYGFTGQGYRINKREGVWQLVPTSYLEFPIDLGDSVLQGNGPTSVRLISKGTRITVPAGTYVCFEYEETNPQQNNSVVNRYFLAPSLGVVRKAAYSFPSAVPTVTHQLTVSELR